LLNCQSTGLSPWTCESGLPALCQAAERLFRAGEMGFRSASRSRDPRPVPRISSAQPRYSRRLGAEPSLSTTCHARDLCGELRHARARRQDLAAASLVARLSLFLPGGAVPLIRKPARHDRNVASGQAEAPLPSGAERSADCVRRRRGSGQCALPGDSELPLLTTASRRCEQRRNFRAGQPTLRAAG